MDGFCGTDGAVPFSKHRLIQRFARSCNRRLLALLSLLAAGRLVCGLLRLIAAVVAVVVCDGLGDLFRRQLASASKMQNIFFDCWVGFGCFHGYLLIQGRAL